MHASPKRRVKERARVATLAGLVLATCALVSCIPGGNAGTLETVSIGVPPLEQNALMYIAADQKFFAAHGLDVIFKDYDSGVTTIDALINEQVDLAEAAEFPFVRAVFQKAPISIVASNDKFENDYLVGRKDRGIQKLADLKGKRIGVTRQTINEFFFGRFLELNGIRPQQVTVVDLKPAQFVDALAGGDLDAVVAWQPYVQQFRTKLANALVVWPAQSNQAVYGVLICRQAWLPAHKEMVKRFLGALSQARDYAVRHPSKAQAIIQKRLNYDNAYVIDIWPQHQFSLSLDFSLLVAMNDEARWLIANDLTVERQVPNWLDYVYLDGLKAVEPSAVNIVP